MGRRHLTHASPHFSVPVLCWPCYIPLQRQSHDLQVGVIVGRPLHGSLRVHHVYANIRHDSPYYTPLSLPVWHIVTRTLFFIYRFLRWFNWSVRYHYSVYLRFLNLEKSCRKSLARGMQKTAEETALNSPSEIAARAFKWTFDCLDEDYELERFFFGLPGLRSSKVANDPLPSLTEEEVQKLYSALRGLLDRTFSSDFLSPSFKNRQALVCAKAIDPEHMPNALILHAILFKYQHTGPVATAIANILRECRNDMDRYQIWNAQVDIYIITVTRQPFDDSWYILASNELGFPETYLREYAAHGNDWSLVTLIHVVRQQFTHFKKPYWPEYGFTSVLEAASNLDVTDTSPELQHEFCALWNQVVNETQDGDDHDIADLILGQIRNVFLALHQDIDSNEAYIRWLPSSYQVCKAPDHRSVDVSMTLARANPHTAFVPSLPSPDPPSLSAHAPLLVNETFADAPPLDNQISDQGSPRPIDQTTTESRRIPITSLSSVTAPEPSTYSPPKSNTLASPPDDIATEHTELSRAPSDDLNVRSSLSPTSVLDTILPTGLSLFSGRDSI